MEREEYRKIVNEMEKKIDDHFREENDGFDSPVGPEYIDDGEDNGVVGLNWHTFLDEEITEKYVARIANFILAEFKPISLVITPYGDFHRKSA